jgi:hypothetical protein
LAAQPEHHDAWRTRRIVAADVAGMVVTGAERPTRLEYEGSLRLTNRNESASRVLITLVSGASTGNLAIRPRSELRR